jgi:hypothetical protein
MPVDDAEKERRRRLQKAHSDAEIAGDLAAVMATFSEDPENTFNSQVFIGHAAIAQAHAGFGFDRQTPGSLENIVAVVESEFFTDEEIVIMGYLEGDHVGPVGMLPPTNSRIRLRFTNAYRFDAADKLVSERVVMNLAPFSIPDLT